MPNAVKNPHKQEDSSPSEKRSPGISIYPFAVAALSTGCAILAPHVLSPLFNNSSLFILPLLAVVISAWHGGWWPAVSSLLVCYAIIKFMFIEPKHSFVVAEVSNQIGVLLFMFVGIATALLGERQRRSRQAKEAGYRLLLEQRRELEAEIEMRRQFELDLRESEERYRSLAETARAAAERFRVLTESIPQMVWTASAEGNVTYFNRRWQEYTQLVSGNALHDWWQRIVHPDDASRLDGSWQRLLTAPREPFQHEVRIRRAEDGAYRWHSAAVIPLCRPDDTIDQWIGSFSDIDDQKRASVQLEHEVRTRTLALQRSNEALSEFAFVASHDLQEPLRKIQDFCTRLQTRYGGQIDEQGKDYMIRLTKAATRMRQLIQDLLAYSRVTTESHSFVAVPLDSVVSGVLSDLEVLVEQTGAVIEVEPLPTIQADPAQLRRLFLNLIGNALKFHKPGAPPRVKIRPDPVASSDAPGFLRITVEDNGIGFEEQYQDRIFQVFQRLHGRGHYEGTGIGLAICKKIVERHGGEITAQGRPGEGARFVITLPL